MTIADYAGDLADRVRAEGAGSPAVRLALQLAVRLWLDIDRPDITEMQWGLFASDVQTITDQLYPDAPDTAVVIELSELARERDCNLAVRQLVGAVADVLQAASRQPGEPRAWEYAAAAHELQAALEHLP